MQTISLQQPTFLHFTHYQCMQWIFCSGGRSTGSCRQWRAAVSSWWESCCCFHWDKPAVCTLELQLLKESLLTAPTAIGQSLKYQLMPTIYLCCFAPSWPSVRIIDEYSLKLVPFPHVSNNIPLLLTAQVCFTKYQWCGLKLRRGDGDLLSAASDTGVTWWSYPTLPTSHIHTFTCFPHHNGHFP